MRPVAKTALSLAVVALLGAGTGALAVHVLLLRGLPDLRSLDGYRPNLITRVYSAKDELVSEFYRERREIVPIERVPEHVVHAFVAAEDDAFYEHEGLDYASILRAAIANLRAGGIRQGGSTITQQVAKTFLLSSERTFVRKLKDMILAKRIEDHLDKNEILFLYLNQIYLGSGAYGIEAAAKTYFAKSVDDLTLAEAALVAGLVPAPSRYTPFRSPELARRRQRFVLRRMMEEEYITEEERRAALEAPLDLVERAPDEVQEAAAYFAEEVRRYLMERYGAEEVLTGGMTVRTSLDVQHQIAAHRAVRKGLRDHDRRTGYRGPLRTVKKSAFDEALAEIEERNGMPPWAQGRILHALVTEVDDDRETAHFLLGHAQETELALEDVEWARKPDPAKDGAATKIRRIRQALRPGSVVELEQVADPTPGEDGAAPLPPRYELYQEPQAEGALLAVRIPSGLVTAMTGGLSFARSQYNRAVQSRRQPGSAFKPIIYATALQYAGYTPASIVYDTPIVYEDEETGGLWKPGNYTDKFYGPITMREALARSRNIATIKILRDVGIRRAVRMARSLGIRSPLEKDLSLALGSSEVTLSELVKAYSAFPNRGEPVEPVFILEIRDREGKLLEENVSLFAAELQPEEEPEHQGPEAPPPSELEEMLTRLRESMSEEDLQNGNGSEEPEGLDPVSAYLMTDLLRAVVLEGTGWRVKALKRPVAGKTGTTNDLRDAWFLGFSPQLVSGVWIGYDEPRNLGKNEAGSRAAGPIFVDFMQDALARYPRVDFEPPDGIVFARIDRKTGMLAPAGTEETLFQPFRDGTAPTSAPRAGFEPDPRTAPRLD